MKLLFTLCGRAGSKGVRNKNVRDFLGKPLPYYSLAVIDMFIKKHAHEYDRLDIALSTDSQDLISLVEETNVGVFIINRSQDLSGDLVRKVDVIKDAWRRASAANATNYDCVVDLDITSPLRRLVDLENVIEKRKNSAADVIYTVTEARRNPYFNQVMKHGEFYSTVLKSEFATRQQCPPIYDMNASIYAYSNDFLASEHYLFDHADIVIMPDSGILDIDSEEDYQMIQVIAKYLFENVSDFSQINECCSLLYSSVKINQ